MYAETLAEKRRGCGYRKPGGVYLVGEAPDGPCCLFPLPLLTCPVCDGGFHPARGWTWTNPFLLLGAVQPTCNPTTSGCGILALRKINEERAAGIIWVGEKYYPDPHSFLREAHNMGISRKLARLPKGFLLDDTIVFLAHRKAVAHYELGREPIFTPGIFAAFRPYVVETVVTEEQAKDEDAMKLIMSRGINPVVIERIGEQYELPEGEEDGEREG